MLEQDKQIIAVTRPVGKGENTAQLVRSLGWTPLIFHTVELKLLKDVVIRDQIGLSVMDRRVDWIVFMSSSGVKPLLTSLNSNESTRSILRETQYLAVGPRTRESLLDHSDVQVEVPRRYSSDGVREFFAKLDLDNRRIVLVRSSSANDSLAKSLESMGASVRTINVYESDAPTDLTSVFRFLEELSVDHLSAVLFTSAISVSNLFKIAQTKFEQRETVRLLNRVRVGAIGPVTAEELRGRGVAPDIPDEYLIESAVRKLVVPMDGPQLR